MTNKIENTHRNDDASPFDAADLSDKLSAAIAECILAGERFPFVWGTDGEMINSITVERVAHTDGSSNLEIRLHN